MTTAPASSKNATSAPVSESAEGARARSVGTRERSVVAVVAAIAVLGSAVSLASSSVERASRIAGLYDRIAFSTSTYTDPGMAGAIFDRDARTAWSDAGRVLARGRYFVPADLSSPIPDPSSLHLTVEVGLSHFPGIPPATNRVRELIIWSGDQSSKEMYASRSRPRKVHLSFFIQPLVDMDREYRFPGQPRLWVSRTVELQDTPTPQRIDLDFLPEIPESPKFPVNISQTWLRLVVETYYPGTGEPNATAISELDFVETHPTIPPMEGDRQAWPLLRTRGR